MIALGFLAAVAYWPEALLSAISPRWAILAVGSTAVLVWHAPRWRDLPTAPWLVFLACGALSLLWSPVPLGGVDTWVHFAILFMLFLAAGTVGADGFILGASLGLALSVAVILFATQVGGLDHGGLFFNKNVLGEAAALCAVWALVNKHYWVAIAPVLALGLSTSRAALLAALLVIAVRERQWWLIAVAIVVAAALSSILPWGSESVVARWGAWEKLLGGLTPLGHGLGSIPTALPLMGHAHNDALELVYQLGLGALPLFLLLGFGLMQPGSDALWVFVLLAIVSFPLENPLSAGLAAVLLGGAVRARLHVRDRLNADGVADDFGRNRRMVAAGFSH